MTSTEPATTIEQSVDLAIGGMTCASCAARISKKLNRMDGVSATVNFATGKAHVSYSGDVLPEAVIKTVEATGYTATLPDLLPYKAFRRPVAVPSTTTAPTTLPHCGNDWSLP